MQKTKKLIAIVLTFIMALSVISVMAFAKETDDTLRFGDDGKFTIVNFSDLQDGYPQLAITKDLVKDILAQVKPDLVVLTGDNISGGSTGTKTIVRAAINEFMSIFEKEGVKVAAVFGNHDDETINASKEFQMSVYESYDCFVGFDEGDSLPGCGTYNLPILASDSDKTVFNIWMTDSGTYNTENDLGGYGCTTKEQIAWYVAKSNELKAANGGAPVPSINFQHIIVPEIFDALVKDANGNWALPAGTVGELCETPCPPTHLNNGQFAAFLQQGDVLATVSGHDHTNTFVVPHKGVDIINTPGTGFSSYSNDNVGARVFELNEENPFDYETYTISYFDVYGDDEVATARFLAFSSSSDDVTKFVNFFKYIFGVIFSIFK